MKTLWLVPETPETVIATWLVPTPDEARQVTEVIDCHEVVEHRVAPMLAVAEASRCEKSTPCNVSEAVTTIGELTGLTTVRTGLSNENCLAPVPTRVAMVAIAAACAPSPPALRQTSVVKDIHDCVTQAVIPSRIVGVRFVPTKLSPFRVVEEYPLVGAFGTFRSVITGPS